MASVIQFGKTKRGRDTLIVSNFEYWYDKQNERNVKTWRCCRRQSAKCKAIIKTLDARLVGNESPMHNHQGNIATSLARKALDEMKKKMTETIATPSSSQAAVLVNVAPHVQMALPKRATLSRVLRRHRQIQMQRDGTRATLPASPTDLDFD